MLQTAARFPVRSTHLPSSRPPEEEQRVEGFRFRLFAVALGIAVLFDFGSTHRWDRTPADVLLVVAAFATILRGGSVPALVTVAGLQVLNVLLQSPWYSNHWLFLGLVNAGLLGAAAVSLKRTRGRFDPAAMADVFAPLARWSLLVLYFYVVFHKLNPDFFRPETSAVGSFLNRFSRAFLGRWTPDSVVVAGAVATLVVETAIPLLLCLRRGRRWGLLLGIGFHGVLALTPGGRFFDFSAMVFAFYVVFLPSGSVAWIERQYSARRAGWRQAAPARRGWFFFAGTLAFVPAYLLFHYTPPGKLAAAHPFMALWIAYFTVYGAVVVPSLLRGQGGRLAFRIRPAWLWLIPGLILFNGSNPYLGLKTETSFAMFSNLQTENGRSNHFFVPASLQVFDYQKRCAEILATEHPRLVEFVEEKRLITFFELCCIAEDYPGGAVRFVYEGREYDLEHIGDHGGVLPRPNPLLKRYLRFREFFADGSSGNWH